MSHPARNYFSSYVLSPEEEKHGSQLTSLNIAVIQNNRSRIAEEKLNLPFTPNDPLSYAQQEAYLKGQLDMLTYLLDEHESSQQYHHTTTNSQE